MCSKNCCKVGKIIYGSIDSDIIEENITELETYKAFNEMYIDCCGDDNYLLPSYCVSIGHVNCLKQISKEKGFMYHSDLAIVAVENDQLECLKFIIEKLGHVKTEFDMETIGPKCKKYVEKLLS